MKLLVSYSNPHGNWYVGEFYNSFFNYLKEKNLDATYISTEDLCKKHNGAFNFTETVPSIFNIYNLIIQNTDNEKTFVHSWNDHAPAMLDLNYNSGIKKFNVVKFACVSQLTQAVYDKFKSNFNIQPSFYLLEHYSDHKLIEDNRHQQKLIEKIFFNGLDYGKRKTILQKFRKSEYFDVRAKNNNQEWQQKNDYFECFGKYKYGLGLDGAALICYRDLEAFGLGTLLFREKIQNLFNEPLQEDIHYFNIFDDYAYQVLYHDNDNFTNHINKKVENVLCQDQDKINSVTANAREWFVRNCLIDNQLKQMYSFLDDLAIFE